jgi:hypothetical protein
MKQIDPAEFVLTPVARERDWLIPSAAMTAGLGLAALLLMPVAGYDHIPGLFQPLPQLAELHGSRPDFWTVVQVHKLRKAGVERPIAEIKLKFRAHRATTFAALAGGMLAGIDMLFFMWIKPEVTAVSPFWADGVLANIDHAIFRTDPWRLFRGIDLTVHAGAYSFLWAVGVMATVGWLLAQKPSLERSTALISYFAIWSVFGTIGQYLLSSAGPIFYQRAGLGDRFAELRQQHPASDSDGVGLFVELSLEPHAWRWCGDQCHALPSHCDGGMGRTQLLSSTVEADAAGAAVRALHVGHVSCTRLALCDRRDRRSSRGGDLSLGV